MVVDLRHARLKKTFESLAGSRQTRKRGTHMPMSRRLAPMDSCHLPTTFLSQGDRTKDYSLSQTVAQVMPCSVVSR